MRIAIIGGGITGLTTALALQKVGVDFVVYEKVDQLGEVGAGIWLAPNALKILDWLGLGDEIRAGGHPLGSVEITRKDLKGIRSSKEDYFSDELGNKTIAIHRARLQQILFKYLPVNKVFFGKTFDHILQDTGKVKVIFGAAEEDFDLVLGADGIHSHVRENIYPNAPKRYSGQTCWRGISNMTLPEKWKGAGREAWGNKIRFGFSPISENEVYWFAVKNKKAGGIGPDHIKKHLDKMFEDFDPLVKLMIQNTPEPKIIRNDLYDLKPFDGWSSGRIGLIGDAAHATTPNMGQGACQGIEDAYYMAKLLKEHKGYYSNLFVDFESIRKTKVNYVVKNSWRFGQLAHRPMSQFMLRTAMKLTPSRVMEQQMAKLYEVDGL